MHLRKGFRRSLMWLAPVLALSVIVSLGAVFSLYTARAAATWPTLSQGSSGENVVSVQMMLQARGYKLTADGAYGPQTAATVKSFQSAHKLSADGAVGPQTWPVLVVSTQQGSSGAAVVALQRQLNMHGASLTTDGAFGALTKAALVKFQTSKKLTANGVANAQTWLSLTTTVNAPPPPPPPGTTLWGTDSVQAVNASFLNQIRGSFGTPSFVGRYLDAITFSPMNASEASFIHSQGIHILPIMSDFGGDTTTARGVARANDAISKARALHIPAKTVIIADIETGSSVDAGYIEGWYKTVAAAGYTPGYYMNPFPGSSGFANAFCSAVKSNSAIGNSIMYSTEPDRGRTARSTAPGFAPTGVTCSGKATGRNLIWQYGLQGNGAVGVDTDEMRSSVPIW
ncbi:MAG TPA: peptidoglycan-binding protein [Ktedonobacteraceae bacterium]